MNDTRLPSLILCLWNKILIPLFMENSLRGCLWPARGFLSVDNRMWFKNFKRGRRKISMLHNVKFMLSQKNKGPSNMQPEQRDGTGKVTWVNSELVTCWGHGCVGAQCCLWLSFRQGRGSSRCLAGKWMLSFISLCSCWQAGCDDADGGSSIPLSCCRLVVPRSAEYYLREERPAWQKIIELFTLENTFNIKSNH